MKYVIFSYYDLNNPYTGCYIAEGKYRVNGEQYAVTTESLNDAKKYTSKARAENAARKLCTSCVNLDNYEVVEVEFDLSN